MNLLLSYPRSGNTWIRYCVEYLTKRPTIGYTILRSAKTDMKCLGSFVDLGVDLDSGNILVKRHALDYLDEDVDKLIIIVRNYKECIIRHCTNKRLNIELLKQSNYIELIQYYDTFDGDKLFIYYEDLITDLEPVLKDILTLLECNDDHLELFIKNLDKHKEQSLRLYGNSSTKGKVALFHSHRLSEELNKSWDQYLIQYHKELFNKYLKRYEK